MTELHLHGRLVETFFDLLGNDENDITFSIGWVLAQSPQFRTRLLSAIFPHLDIGEVLAIQLQEHGSDKGYTDIELRSEHVHVIVEAKRGWNLPRPAQLKRYTPRLIKGHARHRAIVVMAECTPEFARSRLPASVNDVVVKYVSWPQVDEWALKGQRVARQPERRLLQELDGYLRGLMNMQDQESNRVYLLVLASGRPAWSSLSWIDFVLKKKCYFHPVGGNGWPATPPTYLGFRYRGKLQSIHHVESKIVPDFAPYFPEIDQRRWQKVKNADAYFLYKLGPAIRPAHEVKTGELYANGRYWAALDLLLTSKTIKEACDLTRKRLARLR